MNHYEVLGVAPWVSDAEIRRAYVHLARQFHPDMHARGGAESSAAAAQRMCELNLAWEVLGDRRRREAYDRVMGFDAASITRS